MKKYLPLVLALGVLGFAATGLLLALTPLERSWKIQDEVVIDKPIAMVYEYVTTAGNWPRWHPSSLKVTAVSGDIFASGAVGDRIREAVRVAGRRAEVTWTVTQKEPPRIWRIDTTLENGRIESSITYDLSPVSDQKTRYRRTVNYRVKSRVLNLMHALSLHERIQMESTAAVNRLRATVENL